MNRSSSDDPYTGDVDETMEPTFDRFTDRARRVIVLAQEDSRLLGHNYIGTEHLVLGLIHEGDGVAARSMGQSGISLETARSAVEEMVGRDSPHAQGRPVFTPGAIASLEMARVESAELGNSYVATWHILLGLIREGHDVGAKVLESFGINLLELRDQVLKQLEFEQGEDGATWSEPREGTDEWTARLVRPGRRPSDYAAAYDELQGILSTKGLSLEEIDEDDFVVTSVHTDNGPGLDLRVKAGKRRD
jgi:ATP-dependent Clp protease ATP-binding subunit ClpA